MSLVQFSTDTIGSQAFSCKIQAFLQNKYWFSYIRKVFTCQPIFRSV